MHATSSYQNGGSKITKIAIVTVLHAAVAIALIQMRVTVQHEKPHAIDVTVLKPKLKIDPPPTPTVEQPLTKTPPIYVPTPIPTDMVPVAPPVLTVTTDTPTGEDKPVKRGENPPTDPPPTVPAAAKPVFQAATAGNCAIPNYPAASARNGDTGTVGLALLIAPDGHVADSKITSTSGFRELDRAAVAALSMCKFKPASTNGIPESAWGKIAYVWALE